MARRVLFPLIFILTVALAPAARADVTIGSTVIPAGATANAASAGTFFVPIGDDPAVPYRVPLGAGSVTQWSVNTTGATAATGVQLLVLRPNDAGGFLVVGTDTENLPTPLPASNVASFTLPTPILVQPGDRLGIASTSNSTVRTYINGTGVGSDSTINVGMFNSQPTAGETLTPTIGESPGGFRLNVAAVLAPAAADLSITQTAAPATVAPGDLAQLTGLANNPTAGPVPATVTDTVPNELAVVSAFSSAGACGVAGHAVTCPLGNVPAGASAPVVLNVLASTPGAIANTMTVGTPFSDPDLTNNSATATLAVQTPPTPTAVPTATPTVTPTATPTAVKAKCVVPPLKRVPLAAARKILTLIDCRAGKVTRAKSRPVPKGTVIRTKPGAGAKLANRAKVALVVSKGR